MNLLQEYAETFDACIESGEGLYLNQQIADLRARLLPLAIRENASMLVSIHSGQPIDIQCSPGWFNIVGDMLDDIKRTMHPDFCVRISCIKEKFGGLRVYYCVRHKDFTEETEEHSPDIPDGLCSFVCERIKAAEKIARKTCEICGEAGELHGGTYIQTLCDHHMDVLKRPPIDPGLRAMLEPVTLGSLLSRM